MLETSTNGAGAGGDGASAVGREDQRGVAELGLPLVSVYRSRAGRDEAARGRRAQDAPPNRPRRGQIPRPEPKHYRTRRVGC